MPLAPDVLDLPGNLALTLDPSRLLLAARTKRTRGGRHRPIEPWSSRFDDLAHLGLELEGGSDGSAGRTAIHQTEVRIWVRAKGGDPIDGRRQGRIRRALDGHLDWIGPVYRTPGRPLPEGGECPLPHVVVVRPASASNQGPGALSDALGELGLVEVEAKSRYLGGLRYFEVEDRSRTAYELRERIRKRLAHLVDEVLFEHMPMASPVAFEPNDTWYVAGSGQWNLRRIGAPAAWDISRGDPSVVIAVMDSGCEQPHEDLVYTADGIDLTTMSGNGSPLPHPVSGRTDGHGTHSAGIAAATLDNGAGVAGIAGASPVLPLASYYTDVEVAAGIRYAVAHGARIVNMSFVTMFWTFYSGPIPAAIEDAERAGCVLCASSGNGDSDVLGRPAHHPLVMAVGASDMADGRWRAPSIARGSSWGDSEVGGVYTGVSVVAPGEQIWTTDLAGAEGITTFDYTDAYIATSASCPHVAGVAALLLSAYPRLTPGEVRSIIERTAEKIGPLPYADVPGYPHGTRNPEFGYGLLHAGRALDFADVMIRDWGGDDGVEPSTPPRGIFYGYSDIVVRPDDDDLFQPSMPEASSYVVRGQPNFIYVRVRNRGPAVARDVDVDVRISPWMGTEFVYPEDWTASDAAHVAPTAITASFPTLEVGEEQIAKFELSAAQVERLWDWADEARHPCLLARTTAENDYAFGAEALAGADLIVRRNNVAQRNLRLAMTATEEITYAGFMAGNEARADEELDIVIRAGRLVPGGEVTICVDPTPPRGRGDHGKRDRCADPCEGVVLLEPTRVEVCVGGCRNVVSLPAGTRIDRGPARAAWAGAKGAAPDPADALCVRLTAPDAVLRLRKPAYRRIALLAQVRLPADARPGERFELDVSQRDLAGRTVGGGIVAFESRAD